MPDVRDIPEDVEAIASTAGDDHQVDLLLAGFRACAKEAIRFLLEEEGLAPDHELPTGLQEHLDRQQSHLAGMLHNDSGLGMDDSYCMTSSDGNETLLISGNSDTECDHVASKIVDSLSLTTNASTDSVPSKETDHYTSEPSLENSSP